MPHPLLIAAIIFLAVFTQSLTGFGIALVAMALLPGLLGIQVATPLVALTALTLECILLLRYHRALNVKAIWRIVLASLAGIPLGILVLRQVDERVIIGALGVVISAYALYALLNIRLPELKHPAWAYGFGLLAGMLGGAYNTSGPPMVVYGNCKRWSPVEFKSNLQGFFILNSLFVVIGHSLSHNFTPIVLSAYLSSLPAVLLGAALGISLDRVLHPARFHTLVLWLLLIMGVRLLLQALF